MHVLMRSLRGFGVMAGLLLSNSFMMTPAMAASITYNFSGDVDHVGTRLSPPPFNTSSAMSGFMTVNTTDGRLSNNNRGSYTIESFSVTVGGYTATFGPSTSNLVEIRNLASGDRFDVNVKDLGGGLVNSLPPNSFEIQLHGSNTIFSNDHLPGPGVLPPSIGSFDSETTWRLVFGSGGTQRTVSGDMLSLTAVPLPAAVILFGAGLVALIGLGAGGLRNLRQPQA